MKLFWHILVVMFLMFWAGYQIGKAHCTDPAAPEGQEGAGA